jgi:AAA15 family ATPase/GTPase
MKITRLQAQNFKSFDTVDVELEDFNVFIGANASGKSNFLSILTFLRDIATEGIENAVSLQGGPNYLRNLQLDKKPTHFRVTGGHGLEDPGSLPEVGEDNTDDNQISVGVTGIEYALALRYTNDHFEVDEEEVGVGGYFREGNKPPYFDKARQNRE